MNTNNDKQPILSICIPTFNRAVYLEKTLVSIVSDENFIKTDDIEIVISNNCSTDNTDEICQKFANKYPNKIKYIKQAKTIKADNHIFTVPNYATGKFVKINNDTCTFKQDSISKILKLLNNYSDAKAFFLANSDGIANENIICKNYDEFLNSASYRITWVGGFLIERAFFNSLDNPQKYADLKLAQVDIYGKILQKDVPIVYNNEYFFEILNPINKGGYNIAEVFGQNFFKILNDFVGTNNGLSKLTLEKEKKVILDFINFYYFDFNHIFAFQKTGYLKFMLPFYGKDFYFYKTYWGILLKQIAQKIFEVKKDEIHKTIKIFGFIKISTRRKLTKKNKDKAE